MLTLHDDDVWDEPPQRSVCSGAWYAPWKPAELPRRLSSADANFALPPRLQHTSPLPFIAPHLSQNVVPALGAVLAIFMAASPTRTVWRTRRRKDIGGEAGRGGAGATSGSPTLLRTVLRPVVNMVCPGYGHPATCMQASDAVLTGQPLPNWTAHNRQVACGRTAGRRYIEGPLPLFLQSSTRCPP